MDVTIGIREEFNSENVWQNLARYIFLIIVLTPGILRINDDVILRNESVFLT